MGKGKTVATVCRQLKHLTETSSVMLIACASNDNSCITKASANAEQLGWLLGFLLYNVGGQDITDTQEKQRESYW